MGTRAGWLRRGAGVVLLTASVTLGAQASAGAVSLVLGGCPGAGFPYTSLFSYPPAPEGFLPDCTFVFGDVRIDARSGAVDIEQNITREVVVDSRGRVTHLSALSAPTFDLTHPWGVLSSVTEGSTQTTLSYDSQGRLTKAVSALGMTSYNYDGAGHLVKIDFGASGSQMFTYDGAGHLTGFSDTGGDTGTFTYDASGRLVNAVSAFTVTDPTDSFSFDAQGNLTGWSNSGPPASSRSYAHDAAGDLTTVTNGPSTEASYAYLAPHRLASVTQGSTTLASFTYDSAGRLTGATPNFGNAWSFAYDSAGRLSSTTSSTHTTTFAYDALGRLLSVTNPDASVVSLSYVPAPATITGKASGGGGGAKLTGTINPMGLPASYHFDYGLSTSYGHSTPSATLPGGSAPIGVSVLLGKLKPGTTYHYRLVASSLSGSSAGVDRVLRTAAACRVPSLRGDTLKQARRALARHHCTLGHVSKPRHPRRHAKLTVASQRPGPGAVRPGGSAVRVKLSAG